VVGGGGAKDGEVGPGGPEAGVEVGEDAVLGDAEGRDGALHPGAVGVEDPGDLGLGVLVRHPQEVAHVHVVEADADDPVRHGGPLSPAR
jgi:hypothetical protein